MAKLLPTLYEDFKDCFALGDAVLPGGSHCMMNCVNQNGRPDLGPNIYITPPGSFTHFHQDGHGTVDSGHYCLSGYNEVVMTRRLTERAKRHALHLLTGAYKMKKGSSFDGLYDLPHADLLGEKRLPSQCLKRAGIGVRSGVACAKRKEVGVIPCHRVFTFMSLAQVRFGR